MVADVPSGPLPPSGPQPDGSELVRVLSYNIRSLRDDRTALVRVVRACDPDLVCVQESPRFWLPRQQAAWLARATGLMVLSGGLSAAGPLLLGRLRAVPQSVHDVFLPRTPGLYQRGFATSVLRLGRAAPVVLTSCHLSLDRRERHLQCELLLEHLELVRAAAGTPHAVVGGDFNEAPEAPGRRLLAERLQDGHAVAPWGISGIPVRGPRFQRIDAVYATPGLQVLGCGIPDLPGRDLLAATDHLPVLALLRLPAAAEHKA
ncbi:endonuclease/exonuclease/phosphatase family protein [Streptacidiphilus sp. EB129]|jgi:endonuclease/exonuclease/phosphatase family metal-dependent hydrolase|uniref:endonuclease/exonuclease/phosphatase family protein n=1 Tax=Streptacidiphilus sp. EB129 TaxID=3156262 RepID=UPI003513ED30